MPLMHSIFTCVWQGLVFSQYNVILTQHAAAVAAGGAGRGSGAHRLKEARRQVRRRSDIHLHIVSTANPGVVGKVETCRADEALQQHATPLLGWFGFCKQRKESLMGGAPR